MTLPIIVLGGGGHAKVVIDTLLKQSLNLLGFTDPGPKSKSILGVPWIGEDEAILKYSVEKIQLANGLGSVKNTILRTAVYEKFKSLGYNFASVTHPSAVISPNADLSEGVIIMAGAIIQPGSQIGCNTIVNTKVSIDHDCKIGANVHLAPGVTISGGVIIEDGVHVGTGTTIIEGIQIGKNSVIGAGSLLIRNVPEGHIVAGSPAKVLNNE